MTSDPYGHAYTSFGSVPNGSTLILHKCSVYEPTAGAQRFGKPVSAKSQWRARCALQMHICTYAKAYHYTLQVIHLLDKCSGSELFLYPDLFGQAII